MFWFLTQQFVLLLVTAAAFAIFGWWVRAKFEKIGATRAELDVERSKNTAFEERAKKAEATAQSSTAELAALKNSTVPKRELEEAQKAVAAEQAKAESTLVQLKKARELQSQAETRNTGNSKAVQAKVFSLENELAALREQAARDRQAVIDSISEIDKLKSEAPGKSDELRAVENELMQSRRDFTASENAALDAKRERDNADAEAGKLRDRLKVLEGELAIARGNAKAGAANAAQNDASDLRIALANAESKAAEALRSVGVARDEAFALKSQLGLLQAELNEAQSAIQTPATESDIEHVRNTLFAAQAEADEAKKAEALALSTAVVLRTEISSLKGQIDKLKAAAVPTVTVTVAPAPAPAPVAEAPILEEAIAAQVAAAPVEDIPAHFDESLAPEEGDKAPPTSV